MQKRRRNELSRPFCREIASSPPEVVYRPGLVRQSARGRYTEISKMRNPQVLGLCVSHTCQPLGFDAVGLLGRDRCGAWSWAWASNIIEAKLKSPGHAKTGASGTCSGEAVYTSR